MHGSTGSLDFWWMLMVGTTVGLTLALGLIVSVLISQRTKLKLEREKLALARASEKKYSDLFHNVSDIVYVHSLDGGILQVSRAVTRLLGYGSEELVGRSVREFVRPRYREAFDSYLRRISTWNSREELVGIIPLASRRDGALYLFEFRSSLIQEDSRTIAVRGIARDVTDRMARERELRRSERRTSALLVESRRMQDNLALLSREILKVQEEERLRVSRELHDDMGQILAAITMNLEIVSRELLSDQAVIKKRIADTRVLIDQVFECVRRFLRELRPETIDQLGLLPAIRQYAHEFTDRTGIEVVLKEHQVVEKLGSEQKLALYRIAQESLTNTAKHAHAQCVTIAISKENHSVVVEIRDDGEGFDQTENRRTEISTKTHLGLLGMRERASLVGGEFSVQSRKLEGTLIRVSLPLQEELSTQHLEN